MSPGDRLANLGYPPAAFCFGVNIGSLPNPMDTSFQDVSGLELKIDTEDFHEGGENRYVLKLPGGVKQGSLSLKRGVAALTSPLLLWCKTVLEGGLALPIVTQTVTVVLYDGGLLPLRTWTLSNAYPVRWETGAFNSQRNEVAIETIEFAFLSLTRTA